MHIEANIDDCALLISDFLPKNLFKSLLLAGNIVSVAEDFNIQYLAKEE